MALFARVAVCIGGGRGIRTLGDLSATTVFKTVAFVHSAIPPVPQGFPQVQWILPRRGGAVNLRAPAMIEITGCYQEVRADGACPTNALRAICRRQRVGASRGKHRSIVPAVGARASYVEHGRAQGNPRVGCARQSRIWRSAWNAWRDSLSQIPRMTSTPPIHGRNTSGTTMVPSAC
jgi:hypothetical protein